MKINNISLTNNNVSITNAGDEYKLSTQATNLSSATLDTTEREFYLPGLTSEAGIAVAISTDWYSGS